MRCLHADRDRVRLDVEERELRPEGETSAHGRVAVRAAVYETEKLLLPAPQCVPTYGLSAAPVPHVSGPSCVNEHVVLAAPLHSVFSTSTNGAPRFVEASTVKSPTASMA